MLTSRSISLSAVLAMLMSSDVRVAKPAATMIRAPRISVPASAQESAGSPALNRVSQAKRRKYMRQGHSGGKYARK